MPATPFPTPTHSTRSARIGGRRLFGLGAAFALAFLVAGCPASKTAGTGASPSTKTGPAKRDGGGELSSSSGLGLVGAEFAAAVKPGTTLVGLDVVVREGFKRLEGKRVGLLTHSAAVDALGRPSLAVLTAAPGHPEVVRLFLPAEGYDAATPAAEAAPASLAGGKFSSLAGDDVVLLNSSTPRPMSSALAGLDLLVVDLQDTGVRFSSVSAALGVLMEEAYLAGISVLVLDRPNPLGGLDVAGPIQDPALYGRPLAFYPMTITHGMTIGELAGLFNGFFGIGAKLDVVRLEGWSRTARWERTQRVWLPADAGATTLESEFLLPAVGLLAGTQLSLDAGGPLAGRVVGAPSLDAAAVAADLVARLGPKTTWTFEPVEFTPTAGPHSGKRCTGIRIGGASGGSSAVDLGLALIATLRKLGGESFRLEDVVERAGAATTLKLLERGAALEAVKEGYADQVVAFQKERFKALIYQQ